MDSPIVNKWWILFLVLFSRFIGPVFLFVYLLIYLICYFMFFALCYHFQLTASFGHQRLLIYRIKIIGWGIETIVNIQPLYFGAQVITKGIILHPYSPR
jgi:hypothetical protein